MIGIINDAVRAYIIDIFGTDVWEACVAKGGPACEYAYVSACPYSDESTYKTLGALAEIQGMDLEDILEDAGFYFNTVYIQGKGYDKLLNSMGGNLVEFLQNLNFFHVHLSLGFKEMSPPAFSVDEVTPESCIFHYYSKRPGLTRFCVGLIRGAAEKMYNTPVEIEILERKGDERLDERPGAGISESGDAAGGGGIPQTVVADHDVLLVRFPPQSSVLQQYSTAATCRLALDPTTLFQLFPFHLVVDVDCRVVQAGRSLTRLYPELRPGRKLEDFFTLTHPYLPICFERIMERSDSVFLFRSKINGMELKGQMTYLQMPTGAPGDLTDANLDLDPDLLNTLGTGAGLATMPSAGASRGVTSGGAALATAQVSAGIGAAGSGGAALSRNPMATLFSRMRPSQGEERGAGRSLSSSGTPGDGPDVAHRLMQPSPAQSRPGSNNRLSFPSSAVGSHRKPPSAVHSFTMPKGTITPAATTPRGLCSHDGSPQHRLRARPAPSCPHLASTTLAEDLQIPSPSDPSADPGEPPVVGISPTTPGEQCAAGGSGLGSPSQGLGTPGSGLGARYGSMGPGGLLTGSRRSSESGGAMLTRTHRGLRLNPGEHLQPVLLFLGSPRAGSIQEMRACGLYVSDLPLFDNSREMVLMAEQRAAEAALKDTYERLSVQFERRSEQLLYQLFPNFIADQLRKGERATAETYPEATILFSDIVGFTTISAESTPMEVCTMLDELYIEFDALIDKYPKVYKVETIGDAYMLVANVTEPCPNHVDMVLDFALDMHRVCSRVKTNQGVPLQIRVGIHTGSVVGGVVGRRMARFHLFGDAVNTASRMESHGVPGFVHISGASHALLKEPHKYLITERGEISVKGKGLMETFLVTGRDGPSTSGPASLPAAAGVVDSSHANAAAAAPSPARSSSSTPLPEPPAPAPPPAS